MTTVLENMYGLLSDLSQLGTGVLGEREDGVDVIKLAQSITNAAEAATSEVNKLVSSNLFNTFSLL